MAVFDPYPTRSKVMKIISAPVLHGPSGPMVVDTPSLYQPESTAGVHSGTCIIILQTVKLLGKGHEQCLKFRVSLLLFR